MVQLGSSRFRQATFGYSGFPATAFLLVFALVWPASAAGNKLTPDEKLQLIRGLVAEIGLAKRTLPRGDKGVELASDGRVLNENYLRQATVNFGPAFRPGDRLEITGIGFRSDKILLDLNGGLGQKKKWYEHIEVGMGTTTTPISSGRGRAQGSQIVLHFHGDIPHLTSGDVKRLLSPLIDWNLHSAAEVESSALPPRLKTAIHDHDVLVGMNTTMVLASKGRPPQKVRERDPQTGDDYEDWIYGRPPGDTTFVRIEGERVIRVIDYKADGSKIVRTEPEVILTDQRQRPVAANQPPNNPSEQRPTLRRPGDAVITSGQSAPGPIMIPGAPPPTPPTPGSDGGQMPRPLPGPGEPGGPTPQSGPPGTQPPQ